MKKKQRYDIWFDTLWNEMEDAWEQIQKQSWFHRFIGFRKVASMYDKDLCRIFFYDGFACGKTETLPTELVQLIRERAKIKARKKQ